MPRSLVLAVVLVGATAPILTAQAPRPTPRPAKPKEPPKVYNNDDLEAARKRPSNVQDLSATGGSTNSGSSGATTSGGYDPSGAAAEPAAQPTPMPPSAEDERRAQIAATEERLKGLDEQAKQILWQYLQSTDTREILALKAEQQQVLDEIESVKTELARLRGQLPPATPTPEPTPIPG